MGLIGFENNSNSNNGLVTLELPGHSSVTTWSVSSFAHVLLCIKGLNNHSQQRHRAPDRSILVCLGLCNKVLFWRMGSSWSRCWQIFWELSFWTANRHLPAIMLHNDESMHQIPHLRRALISSRELQTPEHSLSALASQVSTRPCLNFPPKAQAPSS